MWLKRQGQEAAHKLLEWTIGRRPPFAPSELLHPSTGLCQQSFEKIKNDSRQGLLCSFLASADVVHSESVQCDSSKKIEQTATAFENRTEQTCHAASGSDIEKMHQWVRNQSYTWDAATCLDAQPISDSEDLLYPQQMFKKFTAEESISSHSQVKASVARGIRQSILKQMPALEGVIDEIIPKKAPLIVAKCQGHVNLIIVNQQVLFFNTRDGPYYPTLRLLHKYPDILPKMQVDRGAIKFVMSGANIMCPGLTSPGGKMEDVPAESIVTVTAEGKENALAVAITKLSTSEIRSVNKGIGMDNVHYLNDGLWVYSANINAAPTEKKSS